MAGRRLTNAYCRARPHLQLLLPSRGSRGTRLLQGRGSGRRVVSGLFPFHAAWRRCGTASWTSVAGSAHATLQAFQDWKGAKLIAALAQRTYWLLIMRADLGIARGDLQALKGAAYRGSSWPPTPRFRRLLVEAGLDPVGDNIEVGLVPGASAPGVSFGVHAAQALKEGVIDGFWANAMASEVAVRSGVGAVVMDVRRGDGPSRFPLLHLSRLWSPRTVLSSRSRETVSAAVRAIVKVQKELKANPHRATEVGERLFPASEAALITELVTREPAVLRPRHILRGGGQHECLRPRHRPSLHRCHL